MKQIRPCDQKKQQKKLHAQEREAPREFITRESHYFNGERYLLNVIETKGAAWVKRQHSTLDLYVRPGASREKKSAILDGWYREQLKQKLPLLIAKWEEKMGVKVNEFGIKKMKTRWGTCNTKAHRIWLNLELAKKPAECLEYVVVHLLEPSHNSRFVALMGRFMPKWKSHKDELNRLPIQHGDWSY